MTKWLETLWYKPNPYFRLVLPLSWLFSLLVFMRRKAYALGFFKVWYLPVPVIVVGNIAVGGTGKTPLALWLTDYLKRQGLRPGIISRGYGGRAHHWPQQVRPDSDPVMVGDEAVLLSRRCDCPMAVAPDRVAAGRALLEHSDCNIIISDDGLQHYALGRDIEIAVIDGVRRFGNGQCLPAGPLREKRQRLQEIDFVVSNGLASQHEYAMHLLGDRVINMADKSLHRTLASFAGTPIHAIAGIGNPSRFFSFLKKQKLEIIEHPFPDHCQYTASDILFDDELDVLMTEKDAVKCDRFSARQHWYIPVEAELDEKFSQHLQIVIEQIRDKLGAPGGESR